ncbi:MAG: aminotransferase class III-fold pyridoxal phosphate-dependent enzyme [Bacteroidetes bacterium]|jgi:acetylornithine aminotransferase/acetylornithine/N-succinyldiaminopimelate aminotransferase|nr:aminotransferase class III-fold pyridoxal phosphate-dependent enzyme [Bacteroidota bacterium]
MTTDDIIQTEEAVEIPTYSKFPMALAKGEGSTVWDTDGNKYLDFYGGHCVALLGHCPPRVVQAVQEQAEKLLFYSNVAHSPIRAEAAQKLVDLAPDGLGQVFFANSGSEANETALKLARTYTGRSAVVALEGAFHGRTVGALATTHNETYRAPYTDILPETRFVPWGDHEALKDALAPGDVAAVILEPIQSIAGMRMLPPVCAPGLRELCDAHGTLLIFDEVQTGVGRTGTFSISEHYGITPDLISLAKSLGAGVPVSAVLVSDAIAATVESGDQGSTFGGGMLAMAAVAACLDTLVEENLMDRATAIHAQLAEGLEGLVEEVRGKGCLIGLQLDRPVKPVLNALRDHGVLAGSSADPHVMRIMPPLTSTDDDVQRFIDTFKQVLAPAAA